MTTARETSDSLQPMLEGRVRSAEIGGHVYRQSQQGEPKVRLWDTIDHTWTNPIPEYLVNTMHLRAVVYRCSACTWASTWDNQFANHVRTEAQNLAVHRNAEIKPVTTPSGLGFQCTGCGATNMSSGRAQMHLSAMQSQGDVHQGAHTLLVKRYALGPEAQAEPPRLLIPKTALPHKHSRSRPMRKRR